MGKKKRSAAPDAKAREKPAKGKKKAKVNSKYIQIDQNMYMFTVDKCIYL